MHIEIENKKVNYIVNGEGKNVVLLHGWGANLQSLSPIHNHLSNFFKTYSVDLIGFGKSDLPEEPWGVEEYSDFVDKFIKKLEIKNPILIGHSHGGRTIIKYASKEGVDINKIILIGSAGIKPKRKMKYYVKVYTFKTLKMFLKLPVFKKHSQEILAKARNKFGSSDYRNIPEVLQKTMSRLVNEDLQDILPKVKVPTLLIWGENDTATPVSNGKTMEKLIPNAGLVVLKNAGHYAYLDKLNDFLVIVKNFLKDDMEA